jgi:hypothetical protein
MSFSVLDRQTRSVEFTALRQTACQKIDWPHHKKHCVKVTDVAAEGLSFLETKF